MSYHLGEALPEAEINQMSALSLAHVGDAVYELMTRSCLAKDGTATARRLHSETVSRVNAPAQAKAAEKILPLLTESELAVYKRGRNARVNSVPHASSPAQYHAATGLEALFGWLWLRGETARIEELFGHISEDGNAA